MTLTKDIAAKFAVAAVAVAMIFSAYAPAAQAQTTEDLQQMINDLLAQVAGLQGQLGGEASPAGVASGICPYTWTRDLSQGSEGADVMKLQQFLNSNVDTRVSASGAGSVGAETMYYGPATAAAVSKMQVMYRSEVLTPGGLVNPTGYFGPSSRAKANALCVAAPVDGGDMDEDEDEDEDEDDNGPVSLQGEASLDSAEIDGASDDEVEEGASDAEVAEFTVEFTDGDAEISRIDVKFEKAGANAEDAFETISLWVDGDMVAERDADDEDEYQSDEMTMRFSGLDIIAMEDEEVEIVIAVTTQDNLDAAELGAWDVSVESMRFFDADGVATTDSAALFGADFGETETFTIQVAGFEDELVVKNSNNDPDSATLQVEDNSKSDWYTVFAFDLDTDDSINDIEVTTLGFDVTTLVANADDVIDDAELVIDGETITDWDFTGGSATTMGIVFDVDGDITIDAGDRVEAELMLRFKSANGVNYSNGETVSAVVDVAVLESEGVEDVVASGAASGDTHTLQTEGISTTMTDDSAVVTTGDNAGDDYATFEIEVEVTAFEQDAYIPTDGSTIDAFIVTNAGATSTATVVLDSSADEVNDRFEITEGETETVTLTVTYGPGVGGDIVRLRLNSIGFYDASVAGTLATQLTLPASDYRTDLVTIVN